MQESPTAPPTPLPSSPACQATGAFTVGAATLRNAECFLSGEMYTTSGSFASPRAAPAGMEYKPALTMEKLCFHVPPRPLTLLCCAIPGGVVHCTITSTILA